MTPPEIAQIINVLSMLRQSNSLHLSGNSEEAINLEREARLALVTLLQSNGVDTDKL